jgi:hypothetical protein
MGQFPPCWSWGTGPGWSPAVSAVKQVSIATQPGGTYIINNADFLIVIKSTPFTVYLPPNPQSASKFVVKVGTSGPNGSVIVDGNGYLIDGNATSQMSGYESEAFVFDGSGWNVT